MNIESRAQRDIQRITTNISGAGTSVTFTTPDDSVTKTVVASTTKHMLKADEAGFKSIAKTASIAVSEAALVAAGYTTRDADDEVALAQHKVSWTDVSGITCTYTIRSVRPDEKVGLLILILDFYEAPEPEDP